MNFNDSSINNGSVISLKRLISRLMKLLMNHRGKVVSTATALLALYALRKRKNQRLKKDRQKRSEAQAAKPVDDTKQLPASTLMELIRLVLTSNPAKSR